jgi:uncharacterized membrane protein YgcG
VSNALNRLLWWHILLIGVGASLILAIILFFVSIKPKNEQVDAVRNDTKTTEDSGGTAMAVEKKKKEQKQAEANTVLFNQQWAQYSQLYMPNINFDKDLLMGYEFKIYSEGNKSYGLRDLPRVWGQWVANWYDAQAKAGITRQTVFPVPAFPPDPNKIAALNSISFPQDKPWHVTVLAKSFDQAMAHLERFNKIYKRGMPVVDKVALTGQSPNLQLDYDLIFYIIPPTTPPAEDKALSSSSSGGGGGGGGFGGFSSGGPGFSSGGGGGMTSGGSAK